MSEVEAVDGPDQLRLLVIEHAKLWALLVALPPKFALSLLRALVEVAPPSQMGGAGTKAELFAPMSPTRQRSTGGGGGGGGGDIITNNNYYGHRRHQPHQQS